MTQKGASHVTPPNGLVGKGGRAKGEGGVEEERGRLEERERKKRGWRRVGRRHLAMP